MGHHHPSIQLAVREDVPDILAMIRELADYEHALPCVEATEDSLARTLTFDASIQHTNSGFAKTLILRLPSQPMHRDDKPDAVAGIATYFTTYSTWRAKPGVYLDDLYVRPQYRKRGYGKLLMQALAKQVLAIDGARLEWCCLKWNEPSLHFYRDLGAKEMVSRVGLRVEGEALRQLALAQPDE